MTPEISIIMPVHNTENYLPEALDSLLAQTFSDFELICVDDASTDGSAAVLQQYLTRPEWKYPTHLLQHSSAQGAALSRNHGMEEATGNYLIFLDSDDCFAPEMLRKAWQACQDTSADVAMFGVNYWYPDGRKESIDCRPAQKKYLRDYPVLCHPAQFALLPFVVDHPPWNKLVRRQLVKEKHIQFQDIPNTNDVFFSFSVSLQAEKIVFLDDTLIDYRCEREGNLSVGRKTKKSYRLYAFDAYYTLLQQLGLPEKIRQGFLNYVIKTFCNLSENDPVIQRQYQEELNTKFIQKWGLESLKAEFFYTPNLYDCCCALVQGKIPSPYYESLLQCSDAPIRALFAERFEAKERVALWGAGKYGRLTLQRLNQLGLHLAAVVDMSPQKQGTDCCGYTVRSYAEIRDKVDCILITNSKWRSSIEAQTGGQKEIVDLMEIMENLQAYV